MIGYSRVTDWALAAGGGKQQAGASLFGSASQVAAGMVDERWEEEERERRTLS